MTKTPSAQPTPRALARSLAPDGVTWIRLGDESIPYLWRLTRLGGRRADELETVIEALINTGVSEPELADRLAAYATWSAQTVQSERARASGISISRFLEGAR